MPWSGSSTIVWVINLLFYVAYNIVSWFISLLYQISGLALYVLILSQRTMFQVVVVYLSLLSCWLYVAYNIICFIGGMIPLFILSEFSMEPSSLLLPFPSGLVCSGINMIMDIHDLFLLYLQVSAFLLIVIDCILSVFLCYNSYFWLLAMRPSSDFISVCQW